jgi:hypothetical protein
MTDTFELSDDDLRELFALFSSPTAEEIERIYSSEDRMFFGMRMLRKNTLWCRRGVNTPKLRGEQLCTFFIVTVTRSQKMEEPLTSAHWLNWGWID